MNELNIALYRGASYETITLDAYMKMSEDGRADLQIDFNQISLSLCINGNELLSHLISFGPLTMVASQFEQAIGRLSENKMALLRSGVLDVSEGHYLHFVPLPNDTVLVSIISISELPVSEYFPHGSHREALHQYVNQNERKLIKQNQERGYPTEIKCSRKGLIKDLELNKKLATLNSSPSD